MPYAAVGSARRSVGLPASRLTAEAPRKPLSHPSWAVARAGSFVICLLEDAVRGGRLRAPVRRLARVPVDRRGAPEAALPPELGRGAGRFVCDLSAGGCRTRRSAPRAGPSACPRPG